MNFANKLNRQYPVFSEGPRQTNTCAEYLKPWIPWNEDDAFETNAVYDGRFVGLVWQNRTAGRKGEMENKTTWQSIITTQSHKYKQQQSSFSKKGNVKCCIQTRKQ